MTEQPERRTIRVMVNLTPGVRDRLDEYRFDRRWSRSTAVAVLVERGLDAWMQDKITNQGDDH